MKKFLLLLLLTAQVAVYAQTTVDRRYRPTEEQLAAIKPSAECEKFAQSLVDKAWATAEAEPLTVQQIAYSNPIPITTVNVNVPVQVNTFLVGQTDSYFYTFRPSLGNRVSPGVTPNWSFIKETPGIWYRSRLTTHF